MTTEADAYPFVRMHDLAVERLAAASTDRERAIWQMLLDHLVVPEVDE